MTAHRRASAAATSRRAAAIRSNTRSVSTYSDRTPRSVQAALLKVAALRLAKYKGREIIISNFSVLEVDIYPLLLWITPLPFYTMLDIWDDAQRGRKVLHLDLWPDSRIEAVSFRRGDWEVFLLAQARRLLA